MPSNSHQYHTLHSTLTNCYNTSNLTHSTHSYKPHTLTDVLAPIYRLKTARDATPQDILSESRKSLHYNYDLDKKLQRISAVRSQSSQPLFKNHTKSVKTIRMQETERTEKKFNKTEVHRVIYPGDFEHTKRKHQDIDIRSKLSPISGNQKAVTELCKTLFHKEYQELVKKAQNEVEDDELISLIYKHTPPDLKQSNKPQNIHKNQKVYTWKQRPTLGFKPESRDGATFTLIHNRFYLFGGMSRVLHNDVRVLNPNHAKWTQLQSGCSPQPRMGHFACQYKDKLVIYGGCSVGSTQSGIREFYSEVWYMNTRNGVWLNVQGSGSTPTPRRNMCAATVGRSIVIYGGITQKHTSLEDLYVFDMKHRFWSKMACNGVGPGKISNASFTAVFSKREENFKKNVFEIQNESEFDGFYVFGGRRDDGSYNNEMYILRVLGDAFIWEKIHPSGIPPPPRYNHTALYLHDSLFIYGGRNDEAFKVSGDSCLGDMINFNLNTYAWEQVKMTGFIPDGRWGHSMVAYHSRILILGGLSHKGYLTSEIFEIEIKPSNIKQTLQAEDLDKPHEFKLCLNRVIN